MAKYTIVLTETWTGEWDLDAPDEEGARAKFWDMVSRGEIDLLSDMDLVESDTSVYE